MFNETPLRRTDPANSRAKFHGRETLLTPRLLFTFPGSIVRDSLKELRSTE